MQKTVDRYREYAKETLKNNNAFEVEQRMKQLKEEAANMAKKIEILEISKRKLMGQGIGSCSMNELQEIDNRLERSLKNIRMRKSQLFKDKIQRLRDRGKLLLEENARLSEKCGLRPRQAPLEPQATQTRSAQAQQKEMGSCSHEIQNSDVETDLLIGLPNICWS
ncbi:MADS-box protein AGL42-like isoform X4 [Lycium ferocissimum]|nr:MADS-box protein AGL42-like isoform X4 [Lycium ferocissimum]